MSRRWRSEPEPQLRALTKVFSGDLELLHPILPEVASSCAVSVIFGTYNRHFYLKRCIESIRKACATVPYEIVVCDGGSTDGSSAWLANQPDAQLVHGDLEGAVKAFNAAFQRARGRFVLNLNDDVELHPRAVIQALRHFEDPFVGQVAMGFVTPTKKIPHVLDARGVLYANYGLTRMNIARCVEKICGGFWSPQYYTYGGDTELSMWVRRLGYRIVADLRATVIDRHAKDKLRRRNKHKEQGQSGHVFRSRWPSKDVLKFRGVYPPLPLEEQKRLKMVEVGEPCQVRWERLQEVDPELGKLPSRLALRPERLLHVWLRTDEDPQQSQYDALKRWGSKGHIAIDWLKCRSQLGRELVEAARSLRPTVVFLQLQGPHIDAEALKAIRDDPTLVVALWCGDVGRTNGPWAGFEDGWSHAVARAVDVMLYTGTGQVEMQRKRGMQNAAYLQIGFDQQRYFEKEQERSGIVFLGQNYGAQWNVIPDNDAEVRRQLVQAFRSFPQFTPYGSGWGGSHLHQRGAGDVLRRSTLALSVSLTSQLGRYTSDRMIRSMACGTPTLVKRFVDMEGLGLRHEENVLAWDTVEEAVSLAQKWLSPQKKTELVELGRRGAHLMRTHHTWGVRTQELAAIVRALRGNSY